MGPGPSRRPVASMIAAVVFDFDGVVLDSETAVFESHRRMYERCGAVLTVDDWCDQVGLWVEGQEERWSARLRLMSAIAPDWPTYQALGDAAADALVLTGRRVAIEPEAGFGLVEHDLRVRIDGVAGIVDQAVGMVGMQMG